MARSIHEHVWDFRARVLRAVKFAYPRSQNMQLVTMTDLDSLSHEEATEYASRSVQFVTMTDPDSLSQGKTALYEDSMARFECTPIILPIFDLETGSLSRVGGFYDFLLKDTSFSDRDILILTDAHDVLVANDPSLLPITFQKYGVDVLFAGENEYSHQDHKCRKYFHEWFFRQPFPYLNGGLIMGEKRFLISFYRYLIHRMDSLPSRAVTGRPSDQALLGACFADIMRDRAAPVRVGIDYLGRVILTLNSSTPIPERIEAPLVHVPWLYNPEQREKYRQVRAALSG